MRLRAWLVGLVAIATLAGFVLAGLLNFRLWGYWMSRPDSTEKTIEGSRHLAAYSFVTIDHSGQILTESSRERRAGDAIAFCKPRSNECLEGSSLAAARKRFGDLDEVPEIEAEVLRLIGPSIHSLTTSSFLGAPTGAVFPSRGVAFVLERNRTYEVAVALRTSAIGNDRFGFLQSSLSIGRDQAKVQAAEKFYFEIAGIEGLDWQVTWPILSAAIFVVGLGLLLKNQATAPRPR